MYRIICGNQILNLSKEDLTNLNISKLEPNQINILYKNKNYQFTLLNNSSGFDLIELSIRNRKKIVRIQNSTEQLIESLGYKGSKSKHLDTLFAPMPGIVLAVSVKIGDKIKKGDNLITLEAMKMENILKATHDGIIETLNISKGDKIEKNQILITFC